MNANRATRMATRSVLIACAASMAISSLASCTVPGTTRVIASPGNAIALAPLGENRLAVLAGAPGARAVFIIDNDGAVVSSFGVTGTARAISVASGSGPVYVGVGADDGRRSTGAIERYTLTGTKTRILPMSSTVHALSPAADGVIYALIGAGPRVRALVPVRMDAGTVGAPTPADAAVETVSACTIGAVRYLVTAGESAGISLIDARTNGTRRSSAGSDAVCDATDRTIYALERSSGSSSLSALEVPRLLRRGLIDAPADTIALAVRGSELVTLQSADGRSSISFYPESALRGDLRVGERGE